MRAGRSLVGTAANRPAQAITATAVTITAAAVGAVTWEATNRLAVLS